MASDLAPLQTTDAPIPTIKARLTRIGGRCARDGTLLDFDPWLPHEHRCRQCGALYSRSEDHAWWAMGANLWTVERAVHAAALAVLQHDPAARTIATNILERFAQQYLHWPNRDNVLGPTRPFFSTYLESIWLLNLCHALALLELAPPDDATRTLGGRVRAQIIEPSLALIVQFDEGLSNRQVWNEAAILSALRVLGRWSALDARAHRPDGFLRFLSHGLLDDGSWYEGENYHQFAHRGLWYGVQLLDAAGVPIPAHLRARYAEGFVAPFLGLLPDETFPSRRDSQYRVSIRQWRFAEWCELGITERPDERLRSIRQRLYDNSVPRGDTGRSGSTADAERNMPATALTRADCNWRALLIAAGDELSAQPADAPGSVLLESQGLAVIRRDEGRTYVALEGGHTGGGHGHPDRLALTLQRGNQRLLDDPGTGSYVERTLHWYRSTLAHHAPLVDRRSQVLEPATLVAFEDRGGIGWIVKRARIAPQVVATRSVVVCDGYLVDLLEWTSDNDEEHEITLPLCADAVLPWNATWISETASGAGGLEDGFDFVQEMEACDIAAPFHMQLSDAAFLWVSAGPNASLVRGRVPAPPGTGGTQVRHWVRTRAANGRIVSCWHWEHEGPNRIVRIDANDADGGVCQVETSDGTVARHFLVNSRWRLDLNVGAAISSIDLDELREDGFRESDLQFTPRATNEVTADSAPHAADVPFNLGIDVDIDLTAHPVYNVELGEHHYRRTDDVWRDAGAPTAVVSLGIENEGLLVTIDTSGPVVIPEATADNPLDNERPDVNASGVQLYIAPQPGEPWRHGWLIVPADRPRVTQLVPAGDRSTSGLSPDIHATTTESGWTMQLRLPVHRLPLIDGTCAFDLIVNERPPDRERRRGQLVLSGGTGFAYLRGDRHESAHAIRIRVAPPKQRGRETVA